MEHPERPQVVNITTYYLRNQDIVDVADELLAFQVNASAGTQDTVDKAQMKGIPVVVFTFQAASEPPLHHARLRGGPRTAGNPGPGRVAAQLAESSTVPVPAGRAICGMPRPAWRRPAMSIRSSCDRNLGLISRTASRSRAGTNPAS